MRGSETRRQPSSTSGAAEMPGAEEIDGRLRAILDGDEAGSSWLYDTYAASLLRRLRQRYAYPGGPDPEDLLQDSFVFYLQHNAKVLADFLERQPPEARTSTALERHLWDLACGLASNHRRATARGAKRVPILAPERRRDPGAGAERRLIDRDHLARLDACLEGSGTRVYLYFTLRYRDGLAPEKITAATGWSRKATYKLRQALTTAARHCAERLGLPWARVASGGGSA